MRGKAYSYADDYQIVGRLKQFTDRKGLCLLVVYHTRNGDLEAYLKAVTEDGLPG